MQLMCHYFLFFNSLNLIEYMEKPSDPLVEIVNMLTFNVKILTMPRFFINMVFALILLKV